MQTAPLQRGMTPSNECPRYDTKQSDDEVPVMLELWENAEYPIFAIAPRSTLARNGSMSFNSCNNSCTLNFKSECPFRYKKAIINNLISRAKLISSSKTIFYKEVENIKQALINNGFPNYIVDEQIKRMIKNVNQQNKRCTTPPSQQTFFYRNQMHYNYKSGEKILKTLIHRNILPTDPNKKIKLIIYYDKFKTSNLVIRNNSSPSSGVLQKTNVIYQFKCPLEDCISDYYNNNIYVSLTSTTPSRRLTMHFSDTSSTAQHLKKHSCPTTELRKILTDNTTILEHQNNKQKLQILEALHIRNMQLTLNRINFQTSANVFSYWHYL